MRSLVFAMVVMVLCSTVVMAQDASSQGQASPQVSMVPMMLPVLANKAYAGKTIVGSCTGVLVPVSIGSDMMNCVLSNQNLAVVLTPVMVPVVSAALVCPSGAATGAGPASITVDKSMVSQFVDNPNTVVISTMQPISLDQNLLNQLNCAQPISVDQALINRVCPTASQPFTVMPIMLGCNATAAMTGRGPSATVMLSSADAARVLGCGGSIMVPMVIDKTTMGKMISCNTVRMTVPAMVPVTIAPSTTSP